MLKERNSSHDTLKYSLMNSLKKNDCREIEPSRTEADVVIVMKGREICDFGTLFVVYSINSD